MERKNFIRHTENFVCEQCGAQVSGSGYTNHCPQCLFSKHVDNVPGDRANSCGGLMEPRAITIVGGLPDQICHTCLKCGVSRKNKIATDDNRALITSLPHD